MTVFFIILAILNVLCVILYNKAKFWEEMYFQSTGYALRITAQLGIYIIAIIPVICGILGKIDVWWLYWAYFLYVIIVMLYSFINCFSMETERRGIVITSTFNTLMLIGIIVWG